MAFASLRRPVLIAAGALATALIVPLSATSAVSPASAATAPTTASVSTAVVPPTAAQLAAAKKAAVAAKKKAKKARKAAAKKRRAAAKRHRIALRGKKIVKVAARYKGRPYVYGASGPRSFDCSGYTSYVVRQALHVTLPHNAAAQSHSGRIKHVSKAHRKVGDLIFFRTGGYVGHVGIYAGNGTMWDAPHTGSHVKKHTIWSSSVSYGRIR